MMRKIILLLVLLLSFACVAFGQTQTEADVIETISRSASGIESLQCDFVQTKKMKMLNEKLVSTGHLSYRRADRLRWEFVSPYRYTFVLNGDKVLIQKGERTDTIDVNQSKVFKEIARLMVNTMMGKALSSPREFSTSITVSADEYIATLDPQRKDIQRMFRQIILHFDRGTKMVRQIEMEEQNGDSTIIELKNTRQNVPIPDSTFGVD